MIDIFSTLQQSTIGTSLISNDFNYVNALSGIMFHEPLEQFEVVKIGYTNFFWNSNLSSSNEVSPLNSEKDFGEFFDSLPKDNELFKLPAMNFENLDISYDFFEGAVLQPSNNINTLIWGLDFNSTFYFFVLLVVILSFLLLPVTSNLSIIPNGWQIFIESLYKFVGEMIEGQVGKEAQKFFPYIFTVFIFILGSNMLGMTLFSFTLTSHIMVTFTLGVSTFIGLTILGFVIQKIAFLNLFLPTGIPAALLPMLVVIEIISYFSRALSLSIRLFANLMSGHTLLHILAFFSSKLFKYKFIIGLISFILILAIVALEFCIAILQAYVFAILICIYLNDSFHASH